MAPRKKEKINRIYEELNAIYGPQKCALEHADPLQLLVATILSAQCTDRMVNIVTADLFRKYRSAADFASASQEELEQEIHKCGYYRAKAGNIIGACRRIVSDFGGEVPRTMEELTSLPGVGRKTANLVCGDIYGKPAVVTDTHFIRLCNRLGLVDTTDPLKVEKEMRKLLPPDKSNDFCHRTVLFGRDVCTARKANCGGCVLNEICPKKL